MVHASTGVALQARRPEASDTPSTRSNGLPARQVEVDRRIEIAVMGAFTLGTNPLPHSEREAFQNMPAPMAAFARREKPIDQPKFPPIAFALVFQHLSERPKGRIRDGIGQATVANHPVHAQVLNADPVELTHQTRGCLIQGILTGVSDPFLDPSHANALPVPPPAAQNPTGEKPLGPGQTALILGRMLRVADPLPVRHSGQTVYPQINPTGQTCGSQLGKVFFQTKRNEIPTARLLGNRDRRGLGSELPTPHNLEKTQARKLEVGLGRVRTSKLESRVRIFGTLRVPPFLEGRIPTLFVEKPHKSVVQMTQRLLRGDRGHFVKPLRRLVLLPLRQLSRGLVVSNLLLSLKPSIRPPSQRPVIDIPAATENLGKLLLLLFGRIKSETIPNLHA